MPIVRRNRAEIDTARLLAEFAARPWQSEAKIEAQAADDGDTWTREELEQAALSLKQDEALAAEMAEWETATVADGMCGNPSKRTQ